MNSTQSQTSTLPLLPCRPPFLLPLCLHYAASSKVFGCRKCQQTAPETFRHSPKEKTTGNYVYTSVCVCVCVTKETVGAAAAPLRTVGQQIAALAAKRGNGGEAKLDSTVRNMCFVLAACSPNAAKCRCASSLPANCKLSLS